jgi:hypothetical protein
VATGAVSDRDDPGRIDVQFGEQIDSGGDVGEGPRPPAAVADPPILEIPGGVAPRGEVFGQRPSERKVVPRPPEAAVDDDDRPERRVVRTGQLTELGRIRSVAVDRGHCPANPFCRHAS